MAMISMATTLQAAIAELCAAEGLPQDQAMLPMCDLAGALARYQEEGVALFPEILVSSNVAALVPVIQAQGRMLLGSAPTDGVAAAALKVVAPLCKADWFGYIEHTGAMSEFGIMRRSSSPLSLPLAVSLRDCGVPALIFSQSMRGSVDVIGGRGGHVSIDFTASRLAPASPQHDALQVLAETVTRNLPVEDREASSTFLQKTLRSALRAGHGCLVAVVSGDHPPLPELLRTGAVLVPVGGMDLGSAVRACRDAMSVVDASTLYNSSSLLGGMLNSDGITVLSTCFQVLAYRVFIPAAAAAVVGGARRRTFRTLSEHVGGVLEAAFIRSQDGHMECARRNS